MKACAGGRPLNGTVYLDLVARVGTAPWQHDPERGALSQRRRDRNVATVQFNRTFDDGQTQASARNIPNVASSEEGLKQPWNVLRRQTNALVCHG